MAKTAVFWFRRDLRLEDNVGLFHAYENECNVLPLFIFDEEILQKLEEKDDPRVGFIHDQLVRLHAALKDSGSSILVKKGKPLDVFCQLIKEYDIRAVYTNRDYEPYARERDKKVKQLLKSNNICFLDFKDQVIYEADEILKNSGDHYQVFTPYSAAWLKKFKASKFESLSLDKRKKGFYPTAPFPLPSLEELGFKKSHIRIPPLEINRSLIKNYDTTRDFPAENGTSRLGIHLRFGTLSIRRLAVTASELNPVFLNELIWREFYMMILYHNPDVVNKAFKPQYDRIRWRNDEKEFKSWCRGETGYPLVDAGMRQLNQTGYMHNRVRMVTASFLTKHLLIDWRWGETYFARKLLDYELASNNGGWQWAAGTGTDAQPYFRIFNPTAQMEKFDKDRRYVKKWVSEYGTPSYPAPIVDHRAARERALRVYRQALEE
ncbi:cryptochrome/photolyase family protein [Negadavirga shengliensis]|uniref:Cryptochrome/photolyase family protein n=1 Tax=Negadavirga shengliensis TaxID=1389218 RepID=A0ABV9SUX8_9BACT